MWIVVALAVAVLGIGALATRQAYRCGVWTQRVGFALEQYVGVSGPDMSKEERVVLRMESSRPFACPNY